MSNAFAPIVRARPCPIFGRPVHLRGGPHYYSPILLLRPFGFRIAPDTLPSGALCATGFRSVLAVSGFRLRARLDFSIPSCSPGQRGITPAFGYSAPHPSAEGTSTPMTYALPSAHYGVNRTYLNMILSGKNLLATQLQRLLGFTKCKSLGNGEMHATTTGKPSLTSISRMSQDGDQRGLSCSRKMRRGGLRPT